MPSHKVQTHRLEQVKATTLIKRNSLHVKYSIFRFVLFSLVFLLCMVFFRLFVPVSVAAVRSAMRCAPLKRRKQYHTHAHKQHYSHTRAIDTHSVQSPLRTSRSNKRIDSYLTHGPPLLCTPLTPLHSPPHVCTPIEAQNARRR